jgi:esterase/lipase superfamily enzyme
LDEFEPKSKRIIHFATNRKLVDPSANTYERFGDVLDNLTYGYCVVNIPVDRHQRGKLELPMINWWPMRDPKKHFLIDALNVLSEEDFLKQTCEDDVLMFVHGFSIDFRRAVLRTAQLQHDLEFPGRCVTFSWPSPGKKVDLGSLQFEHAYRADEQMGIRSAPALAEVLQRIIARQQQQGRGKLHVIAHSLGNRVFLTAVDRLAASGRLDMAAKPFGVVVSVAADVDPRMFARRMTTVVAAARVVNYYYSLEDVALRASKALHDRMPPAGLLPVFVDGVDTINADNANSQFFYGLGHSYYAASDPMLRDLQKLFVLHLRPALRQPPLAPVAADQPGKPHWAFALERNE